MPRSTLSGWLADGMLGSRPAVVYTLQDVHMLVLVRALREVLSPAAVRRAMTELERTGGLDSLLAAADARGTGEPGRLDLVVDADTADVRICPDDRSLVAAVRSPYGPQTSVVIPLAMELRRARRGFETYASHGPPPARRRPGRPRLHPEIPEVRGSGRLRGAVDDRDER